MEAFSHRPTEGDGISRRYDVYSLNDASSDNTAYLLGGLDLKEDEIRPQEQIAVPTDVLLKDDPTDDQSESEESDGDLEETLQLSQSIFVYRNRRLTKHGHVLEGEIFSDVVDPRSCAIKISECGSKEAEILQLLGPHSHVITLFQSGIFANGLSTQHYLALERCHKLNFRQYLLRQKESGGVHNVMWNFNICNQIVEGMEFVHEKLVVHKDLKPSNILLSPDLTTAKVADFGSSQTLKSTSSMTYCTNMFGTLGYRPPESFGRSFASLKSDIFSLGALFYFTLSDGESPFGRNEDLWDHNVLNGVTDTSHLVEFPNSKAIEHLIQSMLRHERRCRPSIWEIAKHPCWSLDGAIFDVEYNFQEETDDDDVIDDVTRGSQEPVDDFGYELEAIRVIEKIIIQEPKAFLIIFDRFTKHLQRFDPRSKVVKQMHEMNEDMKKNPYAPVALGHHIYTLTDRKQLYRLNYKRKTAMWERLPDINFDHGWFPPTVVASGKIYVVGRVSGTSTKSVSRYDPIRNRWERLTDKNLAARDAAITSTDKFVYCLGGWIDGVGASNRVERFNVITHAWDEIEPMLQERYYGTATVCDRDIFALGGRSRTTRTLNTVEMYNTVTRQWVFINSMTRTRAGSWFRCHCVKGCLLAVSGDDDETIEKYDFRRKEWENVEIKGPTMDIYCSLVVRMAY